MNNFATKESFPPDWRRALSDGLPDFLLQQRWFGGKARTIRSAEIVDIIPLRQSGLEALLLLVAVHYLGSADEAYALPVLHLEGRVPPPGDQPSPLRMPRTGTPAHIVDATMSQDFAQLLLRAIQNGDVFYGERGELRGFSSAQGRSILAGWPARPSSKLLSGEQSNTSIIY